MLSPEDKAKAAQTAELTKQALQVGWDLRWTYDLESEKWSLQPYSVGPWMRPADLINVITLRANAGDQLARRVLQTITESHSHVQADACSSS